MRNAYCSECQARVRLSDSGECPLGHPRSALRDVREGDLPEPVSPASPAVAGPSDTTDPNLSRKQDLVAKSIGRLIVIVPAVIVVAIGLYTGYAAGVQLGQSKLSAWLWSVASMLLTGVIVALMVWNRRRNMRR